MVTTGEAPRYRRRHPFSAEYVLTDEERAAEESVKVAGRHGHVSQTNRYRSQFWLRWAQYRQCGRRKLALLALFIISAGIAIVPSIYTQKSLATRAAVSIFAPPEQGYYQFSIKRSLAEAPFTTKPPMVRMQSYFSVKPLPLEWELTPLAPRRVDYETFPQYRHKPKSELREGCEPMGEWQTALHFACNPFHEWDFWHLFGSVDDQAMLVNSGAYRQVWMIREFDGTRRALKTLRYSKKREFDHRNFDRHRRDAVAYEALSGSSHIADIYGYCVNSAFFDYCDGGDLENLIESNSTLTDEERLRIAYSVAAGVADAHHVDDRGRATIAHTDIKVNQFILLDGEYKLSDFNRARLLSWDPESNKTCGFSVGKNAGMWRSPEEYRYNAETEKVDVWSLGLILYLLLTGEYPYGNIDDDDKVPQFVVGGGRAQVTDKKILGSTHPFHKAMLKAIDRSLVHDPQNRASAREIADILQEALKASGVASYR